jgi:CIC family chloride channel protein
VGVVAGYAAALFHWLLVLTTEAAAYLMGVEGGLTGDFSIVASKLGFSERLLLPSIVALGAFLGGLLVYRFAPEAEGAGTDAAIMAFHRKAGLIDPRVPLVKAVASALTVGFGGSAGTQGPGVQLGSGVGSLIARVLRYGLWDRRIAVVAGMAAALSALFRAPMGTALFAVEVLYKRDLEVLALVPALIASVVAYTVTAPVLGYTEILPRVEVGLAQAYSLESLAFYLALGIFVAPFAVAYVLLFNWVSRSFRKLEPKLHVKAFKPLVGGLLVGVIGIFVPEALGPGMGLLINIFESYEVETVTVSMVLTLLYYAFTKMVATCLSVASGGSGGVFAPSVTIGALLGYSYGLLISPYSPVPAIAYAYLGMAAFFAAVSKVPLATAVMVAEMSGSYHLLVPALIASIVARELSGDISIYSAQLHHRPRPEVASLELVLDQLHEHAEARLVRVGEITDLSYVTLSVHDPVGKAVDMMMKRHQHIVPVVDDHGRLVGVIDASLIGLMLELPPDTPLRSVPLRRPLVLHEDDDIAYAAEQLVSHDSEYAIVVNGSARYRGVVTVSDIAAAALALIAGRAIAETRAGRSDRKAAGTGS